MRAYQVRQEVGREEFDELVARVSLLESYLLHPAEEGNPKRLHPADDSEQKEGE